MLRASYAYEMSCTRSKYHKMRLERAEMVGRFVWVEWGRAFFLLRWDKALTRD
jgi:hypothetical protein